MSADVEYRTGVKGSPASIRCSVLGAGTAENTALMVPIETLRDQDLETYRVACLNAATRYNGQALVAEREQNRRDRESTK